MSSFSERHNFTTPRTILYRESLPIDLRIVIFDIFMRHMNPKFIWSSIEGCFNPYGIDKLPLYKDPISISKEEDSQEAISSKQFVLGCQWFQVFDLIEDVFKQMEFFDEENRHIPEEDGSLDAYTFQEQLNDFFVHAGVGWQIVDGLVITRSSEASEETQRRANEVLQEKKMTTAAEHLHFAAKALSARPESDTNGAISRATSAVECVLGTINGENQTLGRHLDRQKAKVDPALKKGLEGIYGFASEVGARHGKEGRKASYDEADFVVSVCAAVCTFMASAESIQP